MYDDDRFGVPHSHALRNPFNMPHSSIQETNLAYQISQQFIANNPGDIIFNKFNMTLSREKYSIRDVILKLKSYVANSRIAMPHDKRTVYIMADAPEPALIWINIEEYEEALKFKIDITGAIPVVDRITSSIRTDFEREMLPVINWWFQGRHGPETKTFFPTDSKLKIRPEYYPEMGDPEKYLADYMASDAAILMLAGPPGTGKTTLLRHLITKYKLSAHVIYDERLMDNDSPFQSFLFGNDGPRRADDDDDDQDNIMIIEDADTILTSREKDNNKLMSRFLNVSDGLIKLPNKKLVFTTNISDFAMIDSALIRPGRCFGVAQMRALDTVETKAAANAAGKPVPIGKHEYTLAEIFNQGKAATVRGIGFGTRHG